MYLRGVPTAIVTAPRQYNAEPNWAGAFDKWVTELTQPSWVLNARPARAGDVAITGFAGLADAQSAYIQPVPVGFPAAPTRIVIRGMKFPVGWNGSHTAISIANVPAGIIGEGGIAAGPALFIKPARKHYVTEPAWGQTSGGAIQVFTALNPAIRDAHVVRISEHKVGRPFGQPRGRRPSV
jgi:hypothetical protein